MIPLSRIHSLDFTDLAEVVRSNLTAFTTSSSISPVSICCRISFKMSFSSPKISIPSSVRIAKRSGVSEYFTLPHSFRPDPSDSEQFRSEFTRNPRNLLGMRSQWNQSQILKILGFFPSTFRAHSELLIGNTRI